MIDTRLSRRNAIRAAASLAVVAAVAMPLPIQGFAVSAQSSRSGDSVEAFYASRGWQPMWFAQPGRQVDVLMQTLSSAQLDGLDARRYRLRDLQRAVRSARSGNPNAIRKADVMLSQALVNYARDLRRNPAPKTIYVDPELRPDRQSTGAILQAAANAPSLERYIAGMGWMHPLYGQLRTAMVSGPYTQPQRAQIALNMQRARELPGLTGRHVVVNAAAQRLYMYENGQVVDYMRVVAGKPAQPTPMMAAFIRFTSLNPYWNVPSDLASSNLAPNVLKQGPGYLRAKGYQVLANTQEKVLDPKSINWKAVAAGQQQVRMRQLPGPSNSMGRMKFMFPNEQGIYLHDSPRDELFDEAARLLSAGCVRLQDADRLGKWLYGKALKPQGAKAEQRVGLDQPVPVYLTYITAVPSGSRVAFFEDSYGWDRSGYADLGGNGAILAAR